MTRLNRDTCHVPTHQTVTLSLCPPGRPDVTVRPEKSRCIVRVFEYGSEIFADPWALKYSESLAGDSEQESKLAVSASPL